MTTTVFWTIATCMVVCAAAALVVPLFWSERAPDEPARRQRQRWSLAAAVVGVPLTSLALYAAWGSPELLGVEPPARASASMPPLHAPSAGSQAGAAGDLAAATARLEARLAANAADPDGWELLAQSYEFAGRDDAAARARLAATGDADAIAAVLQGASSSAALSPQGAERNQADIAALQARVKRAPQDRDAWGALAELQRRERDFPAALASFERRASLGNMTADLWADFADAHGASRGALDETSSGYIEAALRIDPRHIKALWLKASYQTAQRDARSALATWQTLARLIPGDSPDARIIAANVEEARAALGPASPATASVQVSGEISVDARLRKLVPAGAVLFVVAKAVDQPGPPLAVYRTVAGSWPATFRLDDSLAMMPTRRLSDFSSVTIEARVSASGRAEPQPGDLRAISGRIDPRSTGPVRLVIAEQIG
ncbi:MAG: hypothetical protein R3E65_03945 [Steroidobacteraceae bacterium]